MDCGSIMRPIRSKLYVDDLTLTAIDFMMEKHMGLVPVVDRHECFAGLISGDRIMHHLLPKHLTMVRGLDRMSYLRESREELLERLEDLGQTTIGEIMDCHADVVYPDTALVEVYKTLSGSQFVVPVVEKETRKLLGAISFFTILAILRDEEAWSDRVEKGGMDAQGGA
ncbi:CBS domain-containing protein [Magnetococcus sp. PR-3]|uniref:CBS domain-containing protein n=1 Tax=Magnetococcus sp. PR-3 TaxID=3120355 RepID=UPI002FCE2DD4